ncbi:MAG TPA: hypothetical protein VFM93_13220 [Candidatus Limnocylindria bacterium]|nr:hypothetical protein [Candidatus Limnocylindria bacterium]
MTAQRLGIRVADAETEGILHVPEVRAAATAVVLPDAEPDVALAGALAREGVAALALAFREPRSIASALADAQAALRVVRAHGGVPERMALVGSGFGAAVAAIAAGRDSRVRAAVLVGPPAEIADGWRPMVELSRTRARVLLAQGDAARYAGVLSQARVSHLIRDAVDAAAAAAFIEEAFSPRMRGQED